MSGPESTKAELQSIDVLAALNALQTACAIYRGSDRLIFANAAARAHWPVMFMRLDEGYSRKEAVKFQIASQYEDMPADRLNAITELVYGATRGEMEMDITTALGRILRTEHLPLPGGFVLAISTDITELRAKERELAQALDAADAANAAQRAYAAKLSHEIRTPMNGVLGISDLLARTALDETQQAFVGTIRRSAEALLRVVNESLELARLEAGADALREAPINPVAVLREVADLMAPLARSANLSLEIETPSPPLPAVIADGEKLRQVLINLVGNAVKFTDEGRVLVRLVGEARGRAALLRYVVEDTGPGVPPEERQVIFERFARAGNVKAEGAGLGLAIVKELVSRMGGVVAVGDAPSGGASFSIELELAIDDAGRTSEVA